ncbi:MAG TPA: dihydrofolate reductase family protein [Aeromicrobium sp.]|nr:dihydrofolate reductase family protein [Aeromicrobium sp.]
MTDSPDLEQLYAHPDIGRPWVRTDFVSTVDGAAWTRDGTSGDLGGSVDKAAFRMMRNLCDVVVVGAGTARIEGYRPLTESSVDSTIRARHDLAPVPGLVVVSRSLDVPAALVDGGAVVLTSAVAPKERLSQLREHGDVIVAGDEAIDWSAALEAFDGRGWRRVLCEGGPSLHGDMLAAGAVDELCVTIAPVVASGTAARIAHAVEPIDRPVRLEHAVAVDNVLLTRWSVDRT